MPRYEAFTAPALKLLDADVRFLDIAGNDEILLTALVPAGWSPSAPSITTGTLILREPFLTDSEPPVSRSGRRSDRCTRRSWRV